MLGLLIYGVVVFALIMATFHMGRNSKTALGNWLGGAVPYVMLGLIVSNYLQRPEFSHYSWAQIIAMFIAVECESRRKRPD